MLRLRAGVRVSALVGLVCSCNGTPQDVRDGASGGSASVSGGAANDGGASGGTAGGTGGGASEHGSGGYSGVWTGRCKVHDGELAYGPIGERTELYADMSDILGFPTPTGYGLFWRESWVPDAPQPNLFGMYVDVDFRGGVPQTLTAETIAGALDVSPAPGGFVAAICTPSRDLDNEAEWVRLGEDLAAAGDLPGAPDGAWCREPGVVWTGERLLTWFADTRGLVVASLDEQGVLMGEQIVSAQADEPFVVRFSLNGDRVLLVFNERNASQLLSVVLDAEGIPLGDVRPFGDTPVTASRIAVSPAANGWLVATNQGSSETGLVVWIVSREGLIGPETWPITPTPTVRTSVSYLWAKPSAYGGSLVVGQGSYSSMFSSGLLRLTYVLDDAGQAVYFGGHGDPEYSPVGLIADPSRDLLVERHHGVDGVSQPVTVQEYGCLD